MPITIATGTPGSPIATPGFGTTVAITPDGTTAYVDDVADNTVVPVDVATHSVGTPIAVEEAPQGIAISPDQAPVAHVTVTPAAPGAATSFDASASTVQYGTITSYAWNFGDGVTATTTTPTTTHTYATGGNYPVSVTETDSAGTSTARVFTGQTMSRNGGPQATATATASIAGPAAWTAYVVNNLDNTVTPINLRTLVAGPAIPVGAGPSAVAITPDAKTAYVANDDANTVTPINTATNTAGPAIHVGSQPFSIAITPDGTTAWVANTGDGTVTPINVATNTAGAPLTIPLGVSGVSVSPDGATLYVTGDPNITPVNLATNTVGASFVNVGNPTGTAITPNGSNLLTSNRSNFVTVQDTSTHVRTTDFVLNAGAGDVAITPNGGDRVRRVHRAREGGVVPIDIATGNPAARRSRPAGGPRHHDHARRQDRDRHQPLRPQRHAGVDGDEHHGRDDPGRHQPVRRIAVTPDQAPVARCTSPTPARAARDARRIRLDHPARGHVRRTCGTSVTVRRR